MDDCGIYKIENRINRNIYIGQSSNIRERAQKHWAQLKQGKHDNRHLQNAWNKYGEENFSIKTILLCEKSELTYYEQALLDNHVNVYNICKKCVNSHLGVKRTDETKKRLSESLRKSKNTQRGTHRSEDIKRRISKALTGRFISNTTREKLSKALLGIKRSEETRQKVAKANLGKKQSMETKKKRSESMKKTIRRKKILMESGNDNV